MSRKSRGKVENDLLWEAKVLQREETCELLYKSKPTQTWRPWKVKTPIIAAIDYELLKPHVQHTIVITA
jgi:hypothetical protein